LAHGGGALCRFGGISLNGIERAPKLKQHQRADQTQSNHRLGRASG
jgi:hypothetical protein